MKEKFIKFSIFLLVFLLNIGLALAILSTYISVNGSAAVAVNPNIVLWLPLDEGSGCKANDISQYGNNGTLKPNCPSNSPIWGDSLIFDGIDDYVEIPQSESLSVGTNSFSIDVWVKPDAFEYYDIIITNRQGNPNWKGWVLYRSYYNQKWCFQVSSDNSNFPTVCSDANAQVGVWTHLAVVVNRNQQKMFLYVNGTKQTSEIGISSVGNLTTGRPIRIGLETLQENFKGTIDNPRIWNIALTSEQIQSIFERGR